MMNAGAATENRRVAGAAQDGEGLRIPVIDVDSHPTTFPGDAQVATHLPQRWRTYLEDYGAGFVGTELTVPAQRRYTHRLDAVDSHGRVGFDPDFVVQHHLNAYDLSGCVLSNSFGNTLALGLNCPHALAIDLARAFNDSLAATWFAADARFYGAIIVTPEDQAAAAREIQRCREGTMGPRFVEVMLEPRADRPLGHPTYWPVFEAAEHYGLPVAFHVAPNRRLTACGQVSYYIEEHVGFAFRNYTLLASLIFEGVFERFPRLKVALIELGWTWAAPYAWRLDACYDKLRSEVPHLQRRPSEYIREHFWFSTQPVEEPENGRDVDVLFEMFSDCGLAKHLLYASDYPHWDFDSPYRGVPKRWPLDRRREVLGGNAAELFGIPLRKGSGIVERRRRDAEA